MLVSLLRTPGFGLLMLGLLLLAVFAATGRLEPLESGDSPHYKELAALTFTEYLSVQQQYASPYGYPLFLKWIGWGSPELTAVPYCQLALHWLAVYLFYWGLRGVLDSPWLSGAVAATVLCSNTILEYGRRVMSDAPASSLSIATVAALLFVVRVPRRLLAWGGLGVSVFLTIQVRGAYLFLIPLIPVLGSLLMRMVLCREEWVRWRLRAGVGLLAVCLLPYVAFAGICRMVAGPGADSAMTTGRLLLITSQFLTEDLHAELPAAVRPLARLVLDRQKDLEQGRLPAAFVDYYRSYFPNLTSEPAHQERVPRRPALATGVDFDPATLHTLADLKEVLATAEPEPGAFAPLRDLARRLKELTDHHVLMQMVLSDIWLDETPYKSQSLPLALAIVRARPGACLVHFSEMFLAGLLLATLNSFVQVLLFGALLGLLLLWHVRFVLRGAAASNPSVAPAAVRALHVLLLLGGSFLVGKTLLVVPIAIPVPRYMDAAGVFLPGVTLIALVLFGRYVWAANTCRNGEGCQ